MLSSSSMIEPMPVLKSCPNPDCNGMVTMMSFPDPKYPERALHAGSCRCGWKGPFSDDIERAQNIWNAGSSDNELRKALQEAVTLIDELCVSVDCAAEDIGGQRPALEILQEMGPKLSGWSKVLNEVCPNADLDGHKFCSHCNGSGYIER